MASASEYFRVIQDRVGSEDDVDFLHVNKGDIVRLVKKGDSVITVEKNGKTGKLPLEILEAYTPDQQQLPNQNQQEEVSPNKLTETNQHSVFVETQIEQSTKQIANNQKTILVPLVTQQKAFSSQISTLQTSLNDLLVQINSQSTDEDQDDEDDELNVNIEQAIAKEYPFLEKKEQKQEKEQKSEEKQNNLTNYPLKTPRQPDQQQIQTDLTSTFNIYNVQSKHELTKEQEISQNQDAWSQPGDISEQNNAIVPLEMPEFDDFEVVKKLFGGSIGKTFLVLLKTTGVLYVMKRVKYMDEKDKKQAGMEVAQMKRLASRFTVRLMWTFVDHSSLYIITEYYSGSDLRKVIAELQELPDEEKVARIWEIFAQIILAVDYIHSHGVIHRNIKPENIFIMADGSARLGDYGIVKDLSVMDDMTIAGTKLYMAAETWQTQSVDFTSDIYSSGVVLYELITKRHPFDATTEEEMIEKVTNGDVDELPDWLPAQMKELVLEMLGPDPKARPTTKTILQIEIIKQITQQYEEKLIQKKTREQKLQQQRNEHNATVLSPLTPVSLEQLYILQDEIDQMEESHQISPELIAQLTDSLRIIRSVQTGDQNQISEDMLEIVNEIIENIAQIFPLLIKSIDDDIEYITTSINSGLVIELVDLLRRIDSEEITIQIVEIIKKICQRGTIEQNQLVFEMKAIHSLVPKLENENLDQIDENIESWILTESILNIFIFIVEKGWKNTKQLINQQQTLQQLMQSLNKDPFQSTQTSSAEIFISRQPNQQQSSQSQSEIISSQLQQLLLIPHPYIQQLEDEVVIQSVIENVIVTACNRHSADLLEQIIQQQSQQQQQINVNVKLSCKLLDLIYIEGAKIPSDVQSLVFNHLCEQLKQGNAADQQQALEAISYLVVNQENHDTIVEANILDASLEIFNNPEASKTIVSETNFIETQLKLLNSLPANRIKIKEWHLSPIKTISLNLPNEFMKLLITKSVLKEMANMIDSEYEAVRKTSMIIIQTIIAAGGLNLKIGQQHPFLQQLTDDGSVDRFIVLFLDQSREKQLQQQLNAEISKILVRLFKSIPMPAEINEEII
ncbi:MAG: putative Serine/threonine-protein kinase Nek3 [Streblomastix strix]|uniref:non-specific serine/threonine protein kinase n=1 Tax=Streblomastix strix TaxID=222440 RepID=A0A5J4WWP8_9EUKA|nr:MAG: putative Serine/threonine-protein kinase Nek3 [Streblomastix strix]